jgi:hypothetical protein
MRLACDIPLRPEGKTEVGDGSLDNRCAIRPGFPGERPVEVIGGVILGQDAVEESDIRPPDLPVEVSLEVEQEAQQNEADNAEEQTGPRIQSH